MSSVRLRCRSKVKRSYCGKVRSSCRKPADCRDEKTTGAVDERKGSGSVEGVARSRKGTPDAEAGGGAVEGERALGAKAGGAAEEGGRWRDPAPAAGAGLEAEAERDGAGESGEAGEAGVSGFWADAGGRVSGGEARGGGEQRERTANPDGGGSVEAEAAAGGRGARVAGAPALLRRDGAVGFVGTRLAGGTRAEALSAGDDRRRDQSRPGALCRARHHGRELSLAGELSEAVGAAGRILHRQGQHVYGESSGARGGRTRLGQRLGRRSGGR